jgi:hypothetical protein
VIVERLLGIVFLPLTRPAFSELDDMRVLDRKRIEFFIKDDTRRVAEANLDHLIAAEVHPRTGNNSTFQHPINVEIYANPP